MISGSLLKNIETFNNIWVKWYPRLYKKIKIEADGIAEMSYCPDNNKKMITAFSGGLDAAYVLYKYKKFLNCAQKFNIEKSVMIFGADIPLSQKSQFEMAFKNAQKMTNDVGVELIPVETNYRAFDINWEHSFGSVF